jgi:hypothetical protein
MSISILCLVSFLAACGGGGGGGSTFSPTPPPVVDADPGGIWEGSIANTTLGATYQAAGLSISSGELRFFDEQGNSYVGQISVDGNTYAGSVTAFVAPGFVFNDGSTVTTGTLNGQILERQQLSGTYAMDTDERGSFTFLYNNYYDRDSSLTQMIGTWQDEFGNTYSIDSQGRIFGQDSFGCVYAGRVAVINPDYNAYRVNINLSNCDGLNGSYSGLGALDDFASIGDNGLFIFQVNNGDVAATTTAIAKL